MLTVPSQCITIRCSNTVWPRSYERVERVSGDREKGAGERGREKGERGREKGDEGREKVERYPPFHPLNYMFVNINGRFRVMFTVLHTNSLSFFELWLLFSTFVKIVFLCLSFSKFLLTLRVFGIFGVSCFFVAGKFPPLRCRFIRSWAGEFTLFIGVLRSSIILM